MTEKLLIVIHCGHTDIDVSEFKNPIVYFKGAYAQMQEIVVICESTILTKTVQLLPHSVDKSLL